MTRLMVNSGALLNSIMCQVLMEPNIIFLKVSGNNFSSITQNQIDTNNFSLQLLELASLLHDWYKAKKVVLGCILLCFSAHRSRRSLSLL